MTHICVGELTIIDSDNGLSPWRRQAIIRTNAGILLIGPVETNFRENLIVVQTVSFKKLHLKMASAKWRPLPRPQCVKTCPEIVVCRDPFYSHEIRYTVFFWFCFVLLLFFINIRALCILYITYRYNSPFQEITSGWRWKGLNHWQRQCLLLSSSSRCRLSESGTFSSNRPN